MKIIVDGKDLLSMDGIFSKFSKNISKCIKEMSANKKMKVNSLIKK